MEPPLCLYLYWMCEFVFVFVYLVFVFVYSHLYLIMTTFCFGSLLIWPFSWRLFLFGQSSKFDFGAAPLFVFVFVCANLYLYLCICISICVFVFLFDHDYLFVLVHSWWKSIPEIRAGMAWILSVGAGFQYLTQERSVQKWFPGCQIEDFWCATPTKLRLRA